MVATLSSYTSHNNAASPGAGFDGVVRVSTGVMYGSGVLLNGGRAVLTAAHLLYGATPSDITVYFETSDGLHAAGAAGIKLFPDYDTVNSNGDLALVLLSEPAPVSADRYGLYRDDDAVSQRFTMVGYGLPGTGETGADHNYAGNYLRLKAENRFDADVSTLKEALQDNPAWNPLADSLLVADFDNGESRYDALGFLLGTSGTGTASEGMITSGDSGSPAFIADRVSGIASYIGIYHDKDYDGVPLNSSIGELGFWQRVGYYQEWIDKSLRESYQGAPVRRDEVEQSVTEGDEGTEYVYFLLEFTGERADPDEWVSVDYVTRDGTAVAGEDYLYQSGTAVLYPDESHAVIPVEIIGDTVPETSEYFSLVAYNPVGGSFGDGITELTALRTIIDNDAYI